LLLARSLTVFSTRSLRCSLMCLSLVPCML
jgi:hypothetical protein